MREPTPAGSVQAVRQTAPLPADESASISEAARLLASRRSARQQAQAPTEQQQVNEEPSDQGEEVELEGDLAVEDTELEAEGEGSSEDEAQALEGDEEGEQEEYFLLDGEEIPLKDIKAWREGSMRTEDYQRKTQAVAEQSKALGRLEQELTQFSHGISRFMASQLGPVKHQLEAFKRTDWAELAKTPEKFQAEQAKFQAAKTKYAQLQQTLRGFMGEYAKISERALNLRAEAALPEIRQRIKGWNDAMYAERSQFLVEKYRANPDTVSKITDPWFWELVSDAFNFRKGQELPGKARKIVRANPRVLSGRGASPAPRVPGAQKRETEAMERVRKATSVVSATEAGAELLRQRRENRKIVTPGRRRI